MIKKFYPNAPNQINYKRSSWANDPFTLGSYPHIKPGGSPKDCQAYQESESTGKKIYFAGDGTTCEMISTVTGAYITGVKAAQQIAGVYDDSFGLIRYSSYFVTAFIALLFVYAL